MLKKVENNWVATACGLAICSSGTFNGGAKEGLEEGTLYYLGVLPEHRGLGFATDLLGQGTRALQEIGVWQVFCDTAVANVPMISAFKQVGYRQYSEPWERPV